MIEPAGLARGAAAGVVALAGFAGANAVERPATAGSANHAVCEYVRDTLRKGSLDDLAGAAIAWNVESDADLPGDLAGADEAEFDFDNDGARDRVFRKSFSTHYMTGSALFVQPGRSSAAASSERPADDVTAVFVPCQWNASAIRIVSCPPFAQDNDEAGMAIPRRKPMAPVFFRARYSDLYPFRLGERTYVAITSASAEAVDFTAVVEPAPHARFEPRCLLHRGRIERVW